MLTHISSAIIVIENAKTMVVKALNSKSHRFQICFPGVNKSTMLLTSDKRRLKLSFSKPDKVKEYQFREKKMQLSYTDALVYV